MDDSKHGDLSDDDLEFLRVMTVVRLRGAHHAWLPIWRGDYETKSNKQRWLQVAEESWPNEAQRADPYRYGLQMNKVRRALAEVGQKFWDRVKEMK